MAMYKTILLDRTEWDSVLDTNGNIAVASPPYALAQDVASAIKLFLGELWYDTENGIPYFEEILGHLPPVSLFISYMEKAALTVPGVVSASVIINSFEDRAVNGQVLFVDENGIENSVSF